MSTSQGCRHILQIGTVVTILTLMSITVLNSYASDLKYGVMTDHSNAGGFPDARVGQTVTGSAATNDPSIVTVVFKWHTPPPDTVIQTHLVTSHSSAECLTSATKYTAGITHTDIISGNFQCFTDTFTVPGPTGDWGMQAFFCDNTNNNVNDCIMHGKTSEVVSIKAVSFMVTPESPIGIAALVGSSFAVVGGYMFFRARQKTVHV